MPKGVRKRHKSKHRSNVVQRTKAAQKREEKKKLCRSHEKIIKQSWDKKQTISENLSSMGLATNPNEVVPIRERRRLYLDPVPIEGVEIPKLQIDNTAEANAKRYKKPTKALAKEVISKLEGDAKTAEDKIKHERETVRKHHLPQRDVELAIYFLEKYGDDYQAMSRDSRNLFQHTPKQIKKIINIYKDSSFYKALTSC